MMVTENFAQVLEPMLSRLRFKKSIWPKLGIKRTRWNFEKAFKEWRKNNLKRMESER